MDEKYEAVSFAELSRQMKALERSAGSFAAKGKSEFGAANGLQLDLWDSEDQSYQGALSEALKVERKLSAQYYDSSMGVPRPPSIGMQLTQKPMGRAAGGAKVQQGAQRQGGILQPPAPQKPGGMAAFSPAYSSPPAEMPPSIPANVAIPPHAPGAVPDLASAAAAAESQQKKAGMLSGLFGSLSGMGRKKSAPSSAMAPAPTISPRKQEEIESMTLPTVLQSEDTTVSQQPVLSQVPPPPSMPKQRAVPPSIPQSKKMAAQPPKDSEMPAQGGDLQAAHAQDETGPEKPGAQESEKEQQFGGQADERIAADDQAQQGSIPEESQQAPQAKIDKITKSLSNIFPAQPEVPMLPPADERRSFAVTKKFKAWGEDEEKGEEQEPLLQKAKQPQQKKGAGAAGLAQKGKKKAAGAAGIASESPAGSETESDAEAGANADLDEIILRRKKAVVPRDEESEEAHVPSESEEAPVSQSDEAEEPATLEAMRERMLGKKPAGRQKPTSVMDEIERRLAEEEEQEKREAAQTPALKRLAEARRRISERQEEAGYVPVKEAEPKAAIKPIFRREEEESAGPEEKESGEEEAELPERQAKSKKFPFAKKAPEEKAKDEEDAELAVRPRYGKNAPDEKDGDEPRQPAAKKSRFAKDESEEGQGEAGRPRPKMKQFPFAKKSSEGDEEQAQQPSAEEEEVPPLRKARQAVPPKTALPPKARDDEEDSGEEFAPRTARRIPKISQELAKTKSTLAPKQKAGSAATGTPSTARMVSKTPPTASKKGPYTPSPPKGLAAKFAKPPEERKAAPPPADEEEQPRRTYSTMQPRRQPVAEPQEAEGLGQEEGQGYAPRAGGAGYAPRARLRRPLGGAGRSQYNTSVPPRIASSRPQVVASQQSADEGEGQEAAPPMPPAPKPRGAMQQPLGQQGATTAGREAPSSQPPLPPAPRPQQAALSPPSQSDEVKESAKALGEEALIAYAKDNLKWLYEIYVMGGLTREDFILKIKDKMNEMSAESERLSSQPPPENPAFEKLEGMQKKFKK